MSDASKQTVTIKKYANRRLYNTATSSYVTLENLAAMVKEGIEFNVYDAKTSEDITRSVLTQIIVEEESKSGANNLLPIGFLRQLIGFYGDSMQWMVPKYLEQSMQSLTTNQDQIRTYFQTTFGKMFPFGSTLEQMGKQNIAMFERAMRMFAPFGGAGQGQGQGGFVKSPESAAESSTEDAEQAAEAAFTPSVNVAPTNVTPISSSSSQTVASGEEVQQKIAALQRQLSDLAKTKA
jgi:polyhydroxyalkanoate synthesis repressor PhaR